MTRLLPLLLLLTSCQWLDESRMPCEDDSHCFAGWICGGEVGDLDRHCARGEADEPGDDDDSAPTDRRCSRPLDLADGVLDILDWPLPGTWPDWVPDEAQPSCRPTGYQEYEGTTLTYTDAWEWTDDATFAQWWQDVDSDGVPDLQQVATHGPEGRLESVATWTKAGQSEQVLHFEWDKGGKPLSRKFRPSGIGHAWTWEGDELLLEDYDQLASNGFRVERYFECDEAGWEQRIDQFHTEVVDEIHFSRRVDRFEPEHRILRTWSNGSDPAAPLDAFIDWSTTYEYEGELLFRVLHDSDGDEVPDRTTRHTYDDSERLSFWESDFDGDGFYEDRHRLDYADDGAWEEVSEHWTGAAFEAYAYESFGSDGRPLVAIDGSGTTAWQYNAWGYPDGKFRDVDGDGVQDLFWIHTWRCDF